MSARADDAGTRLLVRTVATEVGCVGVTAGAVLLGHPPFGYSLLAGLVGCALLPLRRLWAPLGVLGALWGLTGGLGWPAALVALYGLGRTTGRISRTWPWLALVGITAVLPVLIVQDLAWSDAVLTVAFVILWAGAPAALGLLMATRQRLTASLAELQTARDATNRARELAVRAEERSRIGREIHDAVGHHATLIAVGAAALAASTADEDTRQGAERLRLLAKRALAEMRTALGLLEGRAGEPAGVAELAGLVARSNASGVQAVLVQDGEPVVLPPVLDRAVYRVVQESLTNAARHAPGAAVRVELGWRDRGLVRVQVGNGPAPGPVPPAATGAADGDGVGGGGSGLVGLAERVRAVGGELVTGPRPDGGFLVTAVLPLGAAAAGAVGSGQLFGEPGQQGMQV